MGALGTAVESVWGVQDAEPGSVVVEPSKPAAGTGMRSYMYFFLHF